MPTSERETRNLGIAILVPLLALVATSAYVIYVPETSSTDVFFGRLVACVVLAFFVYNCVLSFQKGRYVSEVGDPGRSATDESRISPIWAFVCALAVLGLIVSLSGPSKFFEAWQAKLSSGISPESASTGSKSDEAPSSDQTADSSSQSEQRAPIVGPDGMPVEVGPAEPAKRSSYAILQLLFTFALAAVLAYFSIHISRLDNKISNRDTALISHSIIYFVITFLNVLVLGSPLLFGFLASSVPDTIFGVAFSLRFILLGLGALVVAIDALRVFSASYSTMRSIVEQARFALPTSTSRARGLFSVIFVIVFLIGRVVLVAVNFLISVVVWVYVLVFYFIASCLQVVRSAIFSWALLFALIHSIAFALLAITLLNSPWVLAHVRSYFASGDELAVFVMTLAVAGILLISVLMAVIAFVSVYFSWPKAFLTTIPELIAYTLIAVWLNSLLLHLGKGLFGVGPDNFGTVAKLGYTFYVGVLVGTVAFFVAFYQANKRQIVASPT